MDLFKPVKIGSIKSRNHFIRSATYEGKADDRGFPTEEIKNMYEELAKNDVGVIITSYTFISDYEQPAKNQLGIYSGEFIPEYRKITDSIHDLGGRIVLQIVHGSSSSQGFPEKAKVLGPSAVEHPSSGIIPKEMTGQDIESVKKLFCDAALRGKKAGFDAVQIHSAHGYLLSQFLTPVFNKRTDNYGGSPRNRIRLTEEICRAVKETAGDDFPIWVKIDSTDGDENGLTEEDFLEMAPVLAETGIECIEISGRNWRSFEEKDRAYFKDAAMKLSEKIDIPVILTGGLRDMDDMKSVYENSSVSLFGFARPFMQNPSFLETLKQNE